MPGMGDHVVDNCCGDDAAEGSAHTAKGIGLEEGEAIDAPPSPIERLAPCRASRGRGLVIHGGGLRPELLVRMGGFRALIFRPGSILPL